MNHILEALLSMTQAKTREQHQAVEYCQQYPLFSQDETWRWTPLHELSEQKRDIAAASYQYDIPEAIEITTAQVFAPVLTEKNAPFAALNIACLSDTLTLVVPDNYVSATPILVNVDALGKIWQFSRLQVIVGRAAKVSLWLDYRAKNNAAQLSLVMLSVGEKATVDAVLASFGNAEETVAQVGFLYVRQQTGSQVRISALQSGSMLARLDVRVYLMAKDAQFDFGGVQIAASQQVVDYHVQVYHQQLACVSRQIVRGVLQNRSQGIFDGMIQVLPGAQKTDAQQNSRYILLSPEARALAMPRLEIYADDVQCAHGSTVGFLDKDALFYLRARGISLEEAQAMLITSFLHEAVIVQGKIAENLHTTIDEIWHKGEYE